jgi:hypothetical protein
VNDFGVGADPARLNTSGQNQRENERKKNLHFVETKKMKIVFLNNWPVD